MSCYPYYTIGDVSYMIKFQDFVVVRMQIDISLYPGIERGNEGERAMFGEV